MKRWQYDITYRHNKTKKCSTGLKTISGKIEELDEIAEIIEEGPSWYTIKDIRIKLIEKSKLTVEQAKRL